jgi:hypothetical protein
MIVEKYRGAGRHAAPEKPILRRRLCDWFTAQFIRGLPRKIG